MCIESEFNIKAFKARCKHYGWHKVDAADLAPYSPPKIEDPGELSDLDLGTPTSTGADDPLIRIGKPPGSEGTS
jgi:hypothetical protein